MRTYTPAERCMLLLFAKAGQERPLRLRDYRSLKKMLEAVGAADRDGDSPVDLAELRRLGRTEEEAAEILALLDREAALDQYLSWLERHSIRVLTRISPEYPARLRQSLGDRAPMLLFCAGALELLEAQCVSLVGSRQLRPAGARFAAEMGRQCAAQDLCYVSGGAAGADTVGFSAAVEQGGAMVFLADSLEERMDLLRRGRVLLVSLDGPDEHFSIARAYSRNRLIHGMGRAVLVAQTDYGTGGTWQGAVENLKAGWSPVYVYAGEPEDPGVRGLMELGAAPVSLEDLGDLRALRGEQISLYGGE